MKLVIGLGNPGRRYEQTRHNVGFAVAAELARIVGGDSPRTRFEGELIEGSLAGTKVAVLCPSTYMNASGQSVRKAVDFYKLDAADVLVVCDDLNLSLGRLRIRASGSAGGQKGLADVIRHLGDRTGTAAANRYRSSSPKAGPFPITCLANSNRAKQPTIEDATQRAALAAADWVQHGIGFCMNRYNADAKPN